MRRTWETGNYTFPMIWLLFSDQIPLLWYTSLHGKCMGFLVNFPQHGKMQQNPLNVKILGNQFPLFPQYRCFFPLDSQPVVYFIVWEMHGFSHQFPVARANVTKSIVWGEPEKLILILLLQYGCFFSIRFRFYGILYHMGKAWISPTIPIAQENKARSIELREPGKLVPILFPKYGYFFFIRFPSYSIFYHTGNAQFFPSISHSIEKCSKTHTVSSQVLFPQYYFFYLFQNLVILEQKKRIK